MRKEDMKCLKAGTKVVVYGVTTTIKGFILRSESHFSNSEGEKDATINEGIDEYDIRYRILAIDRLDPDEILWDSDCVEVDRSPFPSYCKDNRYLPLTDVFLPRKITDLTDDELVDLYKHVTLGSCFLSDYNNDYGVPREEVFDTIEDFLGFQYEEWGEEYEEYLAAEDFVVYIGL